MRCRGERLPVALPGVQDDKQVPRCSVWVVVLCQEGDPPMKPLAVMMLSGLVLAVFALGMGAGIWFSQHYKIVPIGTPLADTTEALRSAAEQYSPPLVASVDVPRESPPPLPTPPVPEVPPVPAKPAVRSETAAGGAISYRFVPGRNAALWPRRQNSRRGNRSRTGLEHRHGFRFPVGPAYRER